MKNQSKLTDIICEMLKLDSTKLIKTNGSVTKFSTNHDGKYIIQIAVYGLLESFEKIGHELFHYKQEMDGYLKPYDDSFVKKYKGKKEGMFYEYDTECEAEAFGRRLGYHVNELFYSNSSNQTIYHQNNEYFSKMPSLTIESVTDQNKLNELTNKMASYYNDAAMKYDDLFKSYDEKLMEWYEK